MSNVAIVSIGDELINGFTLNTNSSWIGQQIVQYDSIDIKKIITLNDDIEEIKREINSLLNEDYNFILVTGGLGPTHDDITLKAFQTYFNCDLVLDHKHLSDLKSRYSNSAKKDIKLFEAQSKILSISTPIPNDKGTAVGMFIKHGAVNMFIMPGVPLEMKHMFESYILPLYIKPFYKRIIKSSTILTTGIYESKLSDILGSMIAREVDFKVAFLPSYIGVKIRISAINNEKSLLVFRDQIVSRINKYVYGFDDDSIEEIVINELINQNKKLAVAESCTGGYLSKIITDVPGSSKCFIGSIISYSNQIKKQYLSISEKMLKEQGAVSSDVALAMSKEIRLKFNADIGISTTGISGPSGGSDDKPIGRIYIAISVKDNAIVKEFNLMPVRKYHREIAVHVALNMLRLLLK
tara:strand:+ start:3799 stop:5025 length:1227 start_codon:yes stop_codon:yes gene_type:complete